MDRVSIPQIVLMAGVMLSLLGGGFFYVGRKLFRWLCFVLPDVNPRLYLIIPIIIVLSLIIGFMPIDVGIKKHFVWLNWFFIGLWVYFLMSFLVSDAVLLVGRLFKLVPSPTPQVFTVVTGWVVLVVVAGLAFFGTYNGRQIRQVSYSVSVAKETPLESLNIVLVSDTHLGYQNDAKWLSRVVSEINAASPQLVILAGDIFNDNYRALDDPEDAVLSLQSIDSEYGVYAVFGNHDGGDTFTEMLDFLERGGVKVLQEEYVVVEDKFVIVGRSDPSPIGGGALERGETASVLEGVDTSLPVFVIEHQLTRMDSAYIGTADLIFAGHTHGGQMFPAGIATSLMYGELNYGLSRGAGLAGAEQGARGAEGEGSPYVIVTSGAGVWGPPFRLGTNNEVVRVMVEFG